MKTILLIVVFFALYFLWIAFEAKHALPDPDEQPQARENLVVAKP